LPAKITLTIGITYRKNPYSKCS